MIGSFGDKATEALYHGTAKRKFKRIPSTIHGAALRKLDMLDAATVLEDLRQPSGNRLEALEGDLEGFHSIRINDQWRIVFRWSAPDAFEVSITDYH
jgi:proteic killer suppression protein